MPNTMPSVLKIACGSTLVFIALQSSFAYTAPESSGPYIDDGFMTNGCGEIYHAYEIDPQYSVDGSSGVWYHNENQVYDGPDNFAPDPLNNCEDNDNGGAEWTQNPNADNDCDPDWMGDGSDGEAE